MYLVEKHIINKTHSFYNECDELCFNQRIYIIKDYIM